MRRLAKLLLILALVSCGTSQGLPPVSLDLFVPAPSDDPWNGKIAEWQGRNRLDPQSKAEKPSPGPSPLANQYAEFYRDLRRRIVRQTVQWVQSESLRHYRADEGYDHWATLGEVIKTGADDCDGLDLLTFVLLRRLGFEDNEIYRSIIVESESGQHHMVTLWFEDGLRSNPWVLDPTAVAAKGPTRLSDLTGWVPIELFDESAHFQVEKSRAPGAVAKR